MGLADTWLLLCGSSSLRALGWMSVEVTMKKMSSRKTMSVIDDMLKLASTFDLRLSAIAGSNVLT